MTDSLTDRSAFTAELRSPPAAGAPVTITVCTNMRPPTRIAPSCGTSGSGRIAERLPAALAARNVAAKVVTIACLGLCEKGPNLRLAPCGSWFHKIDPARIEELADCIADHLRGGASADGG